MPSTGIVSVTGRERAMLKVLALATTFGVDVARDSTSVAGSLFGSVPMNAVTPMASATAATHHHTRRRSRVFGPIVVAPCVMVALATTSKAKRDRASAHGGR